MQLEDALARRAQADDADRGPLQVDVGVLDDVDERRQHHHRGAVLVVVDHGDVELGVEPVLDLEALWRADVLELDGAKGGGDGLDRLHDHVRVGAVDEDRVAVDPGQQLEQQRLALHDRHARHRADVAEPEDGGAVGDDGHVAGDGGVLVGQLAVGGDGLAHRGHSRGVDQAQIVHRFDLDPRGHLDLAPQVRLLDHVLDLDEIDAVHGARIVTDAIEHGLAGGVDVHVADLVVLAGADRGDLAEGAAQLAHHGGEAAQVAGDVAELETRAFDDADAGFVLHGGLLWPGYGAYVVAARVLATPGGD